MLDVKIGIIENYIRPFSVALLTVMQTQNIYKAIVPDQPSQAVRHAICELQKNLPNHDGLKLAVLQLKEKLDEKDLPGLREYELIGCAKLGNRLFAEPSPNKKGWRISPANKSAHYDERETEAEMKKYAKFLREQGGVVFWHNGEKFKRMQ